MPLPRDPKKPMTAKACRDIANGAFELAGGGFILLHILKLYADKSVAGVSWIAVAFFTIWGFWNLYYYPKLGQKASYWGGLFVAIMNTIWLALLCYYGGVF
jgi:hypothetical protein